MARNPKIERPMDGLYVVRMPASEHRLAFRGGRMTDADRMLRWLVGKTSRYVAAWIVKKGGELALVETIEHLEARAVAALHRIAQDERGEPSVD